MQLVAELCERIAATTKKTEKVAMVAEYFRAREFPDAAISAIFLSGRAFPAFDERTLQIGGSSLWKLLTELAIRDAREKQIPRGPKSARDDKNKMGVAGTPEGVPFQSSGSAALKTTLPEREAFRAQAALTAAYRKRGDLGAAAYDVLLAKAPTKATITLQEVRTTFDQIAGMRTAMAKASILRSLLERGTALEAKYILKIITGELRIGLKESLVEEAIARAYGEPLAAVQRANMLLGDIGETLLLAAEHRLEQARMRLFHPIGFMLASPAADAEEAFQYFEHALVEDKYDGIRAQAHCGPGQVRLFSRTLDEVTYSFPELAGPLAEFAGEVILDGEIVAWRNTEEGSHGVPGAPAAGAMGWGHAMPFGEIQKRLGRKQVSGKLIAEVPIAYVVFDVMYAEGELTLDRPLAQRVQILDRVFAGAQRVRPRPVMNAQGSLMFEPEIEEEAAASGWVLRAPAMRADSPEQLEQYFQQAMARGNEGLMIKDLDSPYMPGRRGRWWLKLKRELATLDVVVTAAEFGHGKRIHVLSDYTFAVRRGEELVNIGKAYSGPTDKEIAGLTEWFLAHTIADHGQLREVDPKIVLEVAFNAIMRSGRHDSGYALRFPRIVRVRQDKLPKEIDTVEAVEAIYKRQHGR
ncbi:MAG TPA: ATP-dependent DNA ligase [Candidatus Binatia bacterium]|nr:ATP-dependent DNA ligase [Candidatus Binatia bacterium]